MSTFWKYFKLNSFNVFLLMNVFFVRNISFLCLDLQQVLFNLLTYLWHCKEDHSDALSFIFKVLDVFEYLPLYGSSVPFHVGKHTHFFRPVSTKGGLRSEQESWHPLRVCITKISNCNMTRHRGCGAQ